MLVDQGGRFQSSRTDSEYNLLAKQDYDSLSPDELDALDALLKDIDAHGKSPILEIGSSSLYRTTPVDIPTFLDDPYYCGKFTKELFPAIREDLIEVFNGRYTEALIGGSLGAGKSTFARFALLRMIYETSCLHDPYEAYGVARGDMIAFPCISVTEKKAHDLVFEKMKNFVSDSPYFQNEFRPKKITDEGGIVFPSGIWIPPGLSTERGVLGINSFAVVMEEVNFFQNVKNTNPNRGTYSDRAEYIYQAVKRRMTTRFLVKGRLPGMIIMLSSKTSLNAFTERRTKEATNDPNIFVRERAVYEIAPDRYCGKKFRVALGTETKNSRILADAESPPEGMAVIEVPIEFRPAFEDDIESAIRDISGYATVSITPFISKREKIYACVDETRVHPFSEYIWKHDVSGNFVWNKICKQNRDGAWEPYCHPGVPRYLSLDLSKSQDATGLSMGCLGPYVQVNRLGREPEMVPSIHIDFVIRIEAATRGEIVYSEIRNMIYQLSAHGFFIKCVSADQFQSAAVLQTLRQQGYQTKEISVDRSPLAYDIVKTAIYENRISYYHYDPLLRELRELQKNWKTGKVDHPNQSDNPHASKDVSDAMAQVCLQLKEAATSVYDEVPLMTGAGLPENISDELWVLENTVAVTHNPDDPTMHPGDVQKEDWRTNAEQRLREATPESADWKKNFNMPFELG